tara:strand:- start:109 stop:234 length:126 start_codon:yes stop_codon:yes gene_type:complete
MINKIKEKIKCLPDDVKHLWKSHKKVCIGVGIAIIVLIVII